MTSQRRPFPDSSDEPIGSHAVRHIELAGTFNLRDVGGYRGRYGTTRWGKLYRSDSLHQLDGTGRAELRARRIGLVLDLRGDDERLVSPSRWNAPDIDVVTEPVSSTPMSAFIAGDSSLEQMYDHLVDHDGERLLAAVGAIARSGTTPVLVHCTAGKDRTGLVIALTLTLAGVDRREVLEDYAATERHLPAELLDEIVTRLRATQARSALHLDELVRLSPPAVLEHTLTRIERLHGSVDSYAMANGLDGADLESLRSALIAPEPDERPSGPPPS